MEDLKKKLEEAAVQAALATSMLKEHYEKANDMIGAAYDNAKRDIKEAAEHAPVQAALGYAEVKENALNAQDKLGAAIDNALRAAREMVDHIPVQAALAEKELGGLDVNALGARVREAIEQVAGNATVQGAIAKLAAEQKIAAAKDEIGAACDNAIRDAREAMEHIPVQAELAREIVRDGLLDANDIIGAAADNIMRAAAELIKSMKK